MKIALISCIGAILAFAFLVLMWRVAPSIGQDIKHHGGSSKVTRAFITNFGAGGMSVIDSERGSLLANVGTDAKPLHLEPDMKSIAMTIMAILLAGTMLAEARSTSETTLDFDTFEVGKTPAGFSTALTGGGGPVSWVIQEDSTAPSGGKVLAQTSTDKTDYRFPLCVYDPLTAKDVEVSVKFKTVSGKVDQAAGLVARFTDKDNYYIVRANALEDNVRLYKVVGGSRKQFAGTKMKVSSGEWHTLKLEVKGKHFEVFFDDKILVEADDDTFKDAGKVGLWTKADSVTYFDDLKIESYDPQ